MPRVRLTAKNVGSLPALAGKRTDYADASHPGFELRVTPAGARSYSVRYFAGGSRVQRFTVGDAHRISLADARKIARKIHARAEMGDDPQAERIEQRRRRAEGSNFAALAERFLESNATRLRPVTLTNWRGILRSAIVPTLGSRRPEEIARGQVREVVQRIASSGRPYFANRTFELIRRVFSWAVSEDLLQASPCVGLRPPAEERERDGVLTSDEIVRVWAALEGEGVLGEAARLLFFTGARRSEVLQATWDEFDLARSLWTIPGTRTKNGDPHPIPLGDGAVDALQRLKDFDRGGRWLVPSPRIDGPWRLVARFMTRLTRRSGVQFRIHDIRRTVATGMASIGTTGEIIEAILGHTPPRLQRTYNLYTRIPEMRSALNSWSAHLKRILSGRREADVMPISAVLRGAVGERA